jgi:transcriptional regulator with XRE-family HTH domain
MMKDKETNPLKEADEEKLLKDIGLRIQAIRRRLNYNQKEFASNLGISNASLSEMEAGNARPRFELIYNIIKLHHVNIHYLLYGEGDMFQAESWESELSGSESFTMTAEYRSFFKELFFKFKTSQLVRTSVMNHFREYVLDNDQRIEKDIRQSTEKSKEKK